MIDWYDVKELIHHIAGEDEDNEEFDHETWLYENYQMSFDGFCEFLEKLTPMCHAWKSPLTEQFYCGFVDKKKGHAIVRVEQ